ncbi:MAG: hypothetical protein KZQ76_13600 [Candidatus Thiodiazotropha sp. (ex Epidulcina cf. delphinae)]|nr:hypothetical protein [Candidatus Thiodiazotropha sp. (ex Epidulcina cf. delphinae)]
MSNEEILAKTELPLYEVQEVSLLDAMLLLRGYGAPTHEPPTRRAVEQRNRRVTSRLQVFDGPMTGC